MPHKSITIFCQFNHAQGPAVITPICLAPYSQLINRGYYWIQYLTFLSCWTTLFSSSITYHHRLLQNVFCVLILVIENNDFVITSYLHDTANYIKSMYYFNTHLLTLWVTYQQYTFKYVWQHESIFWHYTQNYDFQMIEQRQQQVLFFKFIFLN